MTTECVLTAKGATSTVEIFAESNKTTVFTLPSPNAVFPAVIVPTVTNNVATFFDTLGTLKDSGTPVSNLQLKSNILCKTVTNSGSTNLISLNVLGVMSYSTAIASLASSTTASYVEYVNCVNGQINIKFSIPPGSCRISYIVFINEQ